VEAPRLLWRMILHGVILRIRPARVARAYRSVWTEDGAPLLSCSRRQERALQPRLKQDKRADLCLALAMRYGSPSIEAALNELRKKGMRRLLVLPLYPQYSASTTASICDEVFRILSGWRWIPELRVIQHYHEYPPYIEALAASVRQHWDERGRGDRLLMSFHGIPKRYFMAGDPYFCECHKTARLLADALGLSDAEWMLTFQSRFGREEWLQPYTDHTLRQWGKMDVGRVDVICPGFSADCLETLEEIAEQNRDFYLKAGGKDYTYIPALNDRPEHIEALTRLIMDHMQGWDEKGEDAQAIGERADRAKALGARS
jgi:ferrochelatase